MGDDRAVLLLGLGHDAVISETLEPLVSQVDYVMTEDSEVAACGLGDTHVEEKPNHAVCAAGMNASSAAQAA